MAEEELLEAAALHEPEPLPTTGFVVSILQRGKHRKLHVLEGRRYRPEVDYEDLCAYGEIMPSAFNFDLPPGGPPE